MPTASSGMSLTPKQAIFTWTGRAWLTADFIKEKSLLILRHPGTHSIGHCWNDLTINPRVSPKRRKIISPNGKCLISITICCRKIIGVLASYKVMDHSL
ncbi:MAG: hypothetical protein WCP35_00720 [Verrucomicrobiota bacterium]